MVWRMHTSVAATPQVHARDRDRTFFTAAAIANALIICVGFGYSTYARLMLGDPRFGGPTLSTLVRLHAAVSTAWTVMLIVQTRLVAARRVGVHRRLGIAGAMIALALVGLGWVVGVSALNRGVAAGALTEPLAQQIFILSFQELVVFTVLIGAALWLRKRSGTHKRLMLLGTLALIPAATTRPFAFGGVPNVLMMFGLVEVMFVAALYVHDRRSSGQMHPATLWGGGLLVVTAVSRTLVGGTETWMAIAKVLLGQAGT